MGCWVVAGGTVVAVGAGCGVEAGFELAAGLDDVAGDEGADVVDDDDAGFSSLSQPVIETVATITRPTPSTSRNCGRLRLRGHEQRRVAQSAAVV